MADRREGETILYVDDEPANRQLFHRTFGEQFRVLTASSGPEALRLLGEHAVGVVLADQRMPGMSGIQLLEAAAQAHPDTVRVLVTAFPDVDVVVEAINRGAVYRYVAKPWDAQEVADTIRSALEIQALRSSNQALVASLDAQNRLLKRKVEQLRFLNELDRRLKEAGDEQTVLGESLRTLGVELEATEGWYVAPGSASPPLHWSPRGDPAAVGPDEQAAPLAEMAGQELQAPYVQTLSPRSSLCILPLHFQGLRLGSLLFRFCAPAPFDPEELSFSQAASHVISSILFGRRARDEELRRERLLLLGQMASMVVHDLKGPLATILGFVSLLQDELPPEQRGEFGLIIQREVHRLIEMVEELLSFSKGETHLHPEAVDLAELLQEVIGYFEVGFGRENIRAELRAEKGLGLQGDRRKLQKVFINLMQNAREHLLAFAGQRLIRIEAAAEGPWRAILFRNSGPPIPEGLLPRIFDPFVSHGKQQGTGLGLTICRRIVEEHGGRIDVISDGGTCFRILLPAAPPADPER